jgi:hypothetical protein
VPAVVQLAADPAEHGVEGPSLVPAVVQLAADPADHGGWGQLSSEDGAWVEVPA